LSVTGLSYLQVQAHLEKLQLTQSLSVLDRMAEEAAQGQWSYVGFWAGS
jgi:hypothetical protein